jgi:nucleotide-binding universal stress UspA family protein
MERILVAIDNETASQQAVDWAVRRSQRTAGDVRVVSVDEEFWEEPPATAAVISSTSARIAETLPSMRLTTTVLAGPIVETLVAASVEADILVLGSHRLHPVRSALAGSLPLRIAARSACVTVVVPEDWHPREGSIVVGVGLDWTSGPALEWAAAEAARLGRTLDIVHAWQPGNNETMIAALEPDDMALRKRHRRQLDAATARAHALQPKIHIQSHLVRARADDALSIRAGGAELLVIGTHHHSPVAEWVVDGTAQSVLHTLPVPVAIVPTADRHERVPSTDS